jgi:hypothetical protein
MIDRLPTYLPTYRLLIRQRSTDDVDVYLAMDRDPEVVCLIAGPKASATRS